MEIKKTLKTVGGQATTRFKFKGKLDSVIVQPKESPLGKIDLIIESSIGYLILEKSEITGPCYIVPRKQTTPVDSENYDSNANYVPFNLNETISISLLGTDVTADVIMRC